MTENESATIFDVATRAGVSPATVSRVMRNRNNVKHTTLSKVLKAAEELNYKREPSQIHNSNKKNQFIAIIIPDILDPFFVNVLQGILDQAKLYNSHVLTYSSENNPKRDKEIFSSLMKMDHLDGVIFIPSGNEEKFYNDIQTNHLPTIFLDRTPKNCLLSSVTTDDYDGAFQATKYLIALGHKDIVYFGGNSQLSTERNRLKGFRAAFASSGLEVNPEHIIENEFNFDSSFRNTNHLLKQEMHFTAAFAANDLIAMGVKLALAKYGLSIPEHVSIVGYGDMPFARYISLTSVSSPAYELGKNAFSLINGIIEQRISEQQQIVLRPSLIIRETCRSLAP